MTYRLIGANQSPYSVKMRAYLRARRIPFRWEWVNAANREETKHVRPPVIPILQHPDGRFENDSTPLITTLEADISGRPVDCPGAAGLADLLLEDFADEWGTKLMAHLRWHHEADRKQLSSWVGSELAADDNAAAKEKAARAFETRQYERRAVFGSSDENHPFLMTLWSEVTGAIARRLDEAPYIMGNRPGRADFGWFGQLYQALQDVTGRSLILRDTPQIMHWAARMDDLSGIGWAEADGSLPETPAFARMLELTGRYHLPLLTAHATALEAGTGTAKVDVDGKSFEQPVFKYHAKCLETLRKAWKNASSADRFAIAAHMDTGAFQ